MVYEQTVRKSQFLQPLDIEVFRTVKGVLRTFLRRRTLKTMRSDRNEILTIFYLLCVTYANDVGAFSRTSNGGFDLKNIIPQYFN